MLFRSLLTLSLLFALSCHSNLPVGASEPDDIEVSNDPTVAKPALSKIARPELKKLLESAHQQTTLTKSYDPDYVEIPYPNGDIPIEKGVCTDVVIRALRAAGVDLQKEVHEDMAKDFKAYPQKWDLPAPDTNIDHRRVPNLQTFFKRKGKSLAVTAETADYQPGDIVSWDLDGKGLTHIGLVSNIWHKKNKRYLIIHNIGGGAQLDDRLFEWKITGHFRYF